MLGQAQSPLVSGDRVTTRYRYRWLIALVVGLLLGSGAVMVAAAALGGALATGAMAREHRLAALLAALLVFLVFDVSAARRGSISRLGLSRQTPERFGRDMRRADATALVWGLDIGTGVSTFRVTSAIWLGLLGVFLGLVPLYVGWLYGVGISATLGGLIFRKDTGTVVARLPQLLAALRHLQTTYVAVAAALGVAVTVTILGVGSPG